MEDIKLETQVNEQLLKIVDTHATPLYVFDMQMLKKRIEIIKSHLNENISLCYAMKANPFLVKPMDEYIGRFEVCSPGEFAICERAGIDLAHIVLSGVYKAREDVEAVLAKNCEDIVYTVESKMQWEMLVKCAKEKSKKIKVLLRLTSKNQFGIDEKDICEIVENRQKFELVDILGIQYYSGTQKKNIGKINAELQMLDDFCIMLDNKYGFTAQELEYGTGFFVPYFKGDKKISDDALLFDFNEKLKAMAYKGHITLEMGRFLVAECGFYLTKIVDCKTNNDENYCIVDGGIHQMNYYGQMLAMKTPFYSHIQNGKMIDYDSVNNKSDKTNDSVKNDATIKSGYNICGSLCTVGDVLVKNLPLDTPQTGDVLVFKNVGAYSVTEGISLFLSRDLPQVLLLNEENRVDVLRSCQQTNVLNG